MVVRGLGVCLPVPGAGMPAGSGADGLRLTLELAGLAEAAGFRTLWIPDTGVVDPMVVLGALAEHTATVTVGAMVAGAGRRQPAVLAKEVTAVDVLSAGRAALALGVPPLGGRAGVTSGYTMASSDRVASGEGVTSSDRASANGPDDTVAGIGSPAEAEAEAAAEAEAEAEAEAADAAEAAGAPTRGVRAEVARLHRAVAVCRAMFRDPPVHMGGLPGADTGAPNRPPPMRTEGPPLLVGLAGRGRSLVTAVSSADGVVTGGARAAVERTRRAVDAACDATGRGRREVAVVVTRRVWPVPAAAAGREGSAAPGAAPRSQRWADGLVGEMAAEIAELLAGPADGVVVDLGAIVDGSATPAQAVGDIGPDADLAGAFGFWTRVLRETAQAVASRP